MGTINKYLEAVAEYKRLIKLMKDWIKRLENDDVVEVVKEMKEWI